MSDFLKHECGIAAVRLRKPLAYYQDRYGTCLWGLNKLFLLMEKQHNRGQDGTGIGCVKLDMPIGQSYVHRRRSSEKDGLAEIFRKELKNFYKRARKGYLDPKDPESVKQHFDFGGEILVGHLRYGTSGEFDEGSCHPYLRRSNWPTRTLMVMGNFNMTNASELNQVLIDRGQHPIFGTDTQTVLEEIGYHLDEEHTDLYRQLRDSGVPGAEIPDRISTQLDVGKLVAESASAWDGGYTICGVIGNGDMFVMRDPRGIRPCHMLVTDDVIAFASERVPLMTVFEAEARDVRAVDPGALITIKADGALTDAQFSPPRRFTPCSFEKIYFSRGNDPTIYRERKAMGAALVDQVVDSIDGAFERTVFSFIPNTAETAYHGLMDGLRMYRRRQVRDSILAAAEGGNLTPALVDELILRNWPKGEKIAHKDIKLRTFISQEKGRDQLVSHVYDITYGVVRPGENLVAIDDSIVRGTTLKKSILKILARTKPSKIVICSTAPQIRYPDCYGIDMSELGKFIAFQAAVALHRKAGRQSLLDAVYDECRAELEKPAAERRNPVQKIYSAFADEEISAEISNMVYPENLEWSGKVEVIFQTIENLHSSIEGDCGDWYFTGNYPTAGGFSMVNLAYIRWYEGIGGRSYDLPL
ncbi:MAG: amidophosphoribosyltransferase [Akkermansiaceae bacterium]|nr:amidophosphoribosyltransferase [Akkermansiaceae bacterium]MCP5543195.1 amidophosphoribosyltransferase [Akkermansiaceae bacterium]MCP5546323.1 amidophosphoribosyltransferase [Akkermansiaceae bacterium]